MLGTQCCTLKNNLVDRKRGRKGKGADVLGFQIQITIISRNLRDGDF